MGNKYGIRNKDDSFKELIKNRSDLKDTVEGLDPVYELRKKILLLRLDKGLSQEELAARAGMKQSVISRIENGESEPRIETVNRIAKALNRKVKIDLV
ncbi:helix-turn-helix protein [Halanaerobium saccharolyticum]|uniref:Helix-turn-helix protein n=1 Tax=Halanaerobium saccharolyticum TaxID=43595 RepID=A0A4R6M006_9FIRM|nr:helix-turn-helix transcriptional regulator [Halanaerobium saccharolyticum]TDO94226.1 helix-turn-helix protein [Halanaerobium saccharolyticum]